MTRPSNTKKRPPEPVFFIDRNLSGGVFVAHLRLNGLRIEELEAHFPETAEDVEWLRFVGNNGWVAVTQDQLRDDLEAQVALMQHGAKVVVFMGFLPHHELAGLFLRKYKQIRKTVESLDEPFMAKIYVRTAEIKVLRLADLYQSHARRRR